MSLPLSAHIEIFSVFRMGDFWGSFLAKQPTMHSQRVTREDIENRGLMENIILFAHFFLGANICRGERFSVSCLPDLINQYLGIFYYKIVYNNITSWW